MSNVATTQIIQDGQRNVVIKFEGIVDTADIAQTGQIGASGFTTTIGSNAVTFVAGALVPTTGQYVTFSDGTTTFPTGTYITSVVDATHITVSNVAKATNAAAAITITGTAGGIVVADPSALSNMLDGPFASKAKYLRVMKLTYNIEDTLSVNFFWEATANLRIEELVGRGKMDYRRFAGISQNTLVGGIPSGSTGKIIATTQGWITSAVLSFSIILELEKILS